MSLYLKPIFLFTFLIYTLQAEEVFVNKNMVSLGHIHRSYTYCVDTQEYQTFCENKALTYIDYDHDNVPHFLHGLKQNLLPYITTYNKRDTKGSVLANMKDSHGQLSGNWYENQTIDLFAKTPVSYTLSTRSSGYTGGAHGYHAVSFTNYAIDTQKPIHLDDLFVKDYNTTLAAIAEKHYKYIVGLKETQSLQDDGWFDNKFILPENIAITDFGLYLYYNFYEIKPYAAGHTKFLLPYSKLDSIIDPQGMLGVILKKNHFFHTSFYDKEKASFSLNTKVNTDKTLTLTVSIKNLSYMNQGWFSLSFPQLTKKQNIVRKTAEGFSSVHVYPRRSKIYHQGLKKAIQSTYLLVEGENKQWNDNKKHNISLRMKVPAKLKELVVDMRAAFKSGKRMMTVPDAYDGVKGQQGFSNYRITIGL